MSVLVCVSLSMYVSACRIKANSCLILKSRLEKSVTLPRNVLIERTAVKTTACVQEYSSLITPLNTEIDVHLTLTSLLIIDLIPFYLSVIIRHSILGIFSVQSNYHTFQLVQMYIFLTGLL